MAFPVIGSMAAAAIPAIFQMMIERSKPTHEKPQHLCLDKSDDYDAVRVLVNQFGLTAHINSCGQEFDEKRVAGTKARL